MTGYLAWPHRYVNIWKHCAKCCVSDGACLVAICHLERTLIDLFRFPTSRTHLAHICVDCRRRKDNKWPFNFDGLICMSRVEFSNIYKFEQIRAYRYYSADSHGFASIMASRASSNHSSMVFIAFLFGTGTVRNVPYREKYIPMRVIPPRSFLNEESA